MLLLLACTEPEPAADSSVPPDVSQVVGTNETGAPLQAAGAHGVETVTPVACPETIFVAMAGYATDPAVAAERHSEGYGAAPTPTAVHLSWTGDPSSTASLIWRTDYETTASQVEIGPTSDYGTVIEGASFALGTTTTNGRVHEAHVCGLPPGTTWHYRVGGVGGWSPDYVFTTAPPVGSDAPVVFGVAGDSRGSPATWGQVVQGMASHGVDFRLFTGDAVTNGGTVSYWEDWYEQGIGQIESVPTMMAHGNHEGNNQVYYALTASPDNEEWYSFEYGDIFFATWNDTPGTSTDWQTQADWLTEKLATTERKWKIVFHHKAAYSSCRPNGEDMNVRNWFVPISEAGGVQLDLAGHNHNYERSVPLAGGIEVDQASGTIYVVTAGAGAPMYDNNQGFAYTALYAEVNHYVIVEIAGDVGTLKAYDLAGNLIDVVNLVP